MAHRLDGDVELLERRNDDDFDVGVVFLDDLQHVESADSRQADVEHHEIHVFFFHDLQRSFARCGLQQAEITPEDGRQRIAHAFVVIDNEDGLPALRHRRREYNAAP